MNGMKADFRKTMEALNSVSTEKLLSCAHSCTPPDRRKIVRVIKDFQAVLFPLCFRRDDPDMADEVLLGRPCASPAKDARRLWRKQRRHAKPLRPGWLR